VDSSPWHVLHVISNHEKRVAQHLAIRFIEHYLPVYTERVTWTDGPAVTERPLFTGYVFVRFQPRSRISVISAPGVIRLMDDDSKGLVSDEELGKIRDALASGLVLRPHPGLSVGTRVRVREGVFSGGEGMVTELHEHCKVILSLAATQQCFSLEVEIGNLVVLEKLAVTPGLRLAQA
jgi:transcription antitermination factor NusG